jgi:putative SOS response-associated peptidase YedK
MCSRLQFKYANDDSVKRFNLEIGCEGKDLFTEESNRYDYHFYPVITNILPDRIQEDYTWGLIPHWAANDEIKSSTFHARVESLHEKRSYKDILHQRCLVLASGYYEWKHIIETSPQELDLFGEVIPQKGSPKTTTEKHIIHSQEVEIFSLAGLWSHWINPLNGEMVKTFTIVTTEANATMSTIAKNLRMPIMLKKEDEQRWLQGESHLNFAYPGYDNGLIALRS